MGQYRKKPMIIEAFQMTLARRQDNSEWPAWLHEAWNKEPGEPGAVTCRDYPNSDGTDPLRIATLEGNLDVAWGDWIIQGTSGELYPCKPAIFAEIYDPINAASADALYGAGNHELEDSPGVGRLELGAGEEEASDA